MIRAVAIVLCLATASRAEVEAGVRAFREGRYEDAERLLASERDPEALFFEGAARYKLGRSDEAFEAIDEALDRDPALAGEVGELYLGLVLYDLKLYRGARGPLSRVVELNPTGKLAHVAREHLAALDSMTPAPGSVSWYLDRGLGFAAALRPRLAAAFLSEARDLNASFRPDLVALHLAAALNELGRFQLALHSVEGQQGAGPDVERGRALLRLGREAEARVALERAAASGESPWDEAARVLLGAAR